ncbi:xylulokinase [Sungkyunkwania multivorans]|uniref:Xylulokinase n=1 Tax=Sungkyunkwania multivorans TaxID=1173618 RepID=A0ABW3CV23_9FLAO
MYWIGYDVGSSSIKAALIESSNGSVAGIAQYPKKEMSIISEQSGWGEQDPDLWWKHLCEATKELIAKTGVEPDRIEGVGISYQMHGLVLVDKSMQLLRPSIIWCDSRAVTIGDRIFESVGSDKCMQRLLNSPGNFTLSKLKWVQENEPEVFDQIHKFMLPGDYIGYKLTEECLTTPSGLSEAILWDFIADEPAFWLLDATEIDRSLIPEVRPNFSFQGKVTADAAKASGLPEGIPLMYRAGDQPNNALALNVLEPGEIAATGGTSGVVYALSDQVITHESVRINSFAHVNHTDKLPRIGKMLCINGTGIQYSWIRNNLTSGMSYEEMNARAGEVAVGSDGLRIFPFGNGAERMLKNKNPEASIINLNFNIHKKTHLFRAALEGIAFSFVYGLEILKADGVDLSRIKAGNDNLFRSQIFSETIATLTDARIDIVETTGAVGAARAAAYASGIFKNFSEATQHDKIQHTYHPLNIDGAYRAAYEDWKSKLTKTL